MAVPGHKTPELITCNKPSNAEARVRSGLRLWRKRAFKHSISQVTELRIAEIGDRESPGVRRSVEPGAGLELPRAVRAANHRGTPEIADYGQFLREVLEEPSSGPPKIPVVCD
jgi:hypothetical protein